jgi:predicted RNase H-like HicB family nuclease
MTGPDARNPCGARNMKYLIIYERTATGYSAFVPDLPGCVAGGATFEETADLMRGAIAMHLEAMREDGDPIPEPATIADYIEAPTA